MQTRIVSSMLHLSAKLLEIFITLIHLIVILGFCAFDGGLIGIANHSKYSLRTRVDLLVSRSFGKQRLKIKLKT